jgi:hypothetical protein
VTQVPEAGRLMHASELCRHGSFTVLHLAGRANQGLAWGAGEPWLLQGRTRAPCGGCWPGRCHAQAPHIPSAVSVGQRDAARGSPSTTRRTCARFTRNGGLSTNNPGDARRRTHPGVRWRSGTCSGSGSAAWKGSISTRKPLPTSPKEDVKGSACGLRRGNEEGRLSQRPSGRRPS